MLIAVPKEIHPGETRIPVVPATLEKLVKKGANISVESGIGGSCGITDAEYEKVGVTIEKDRKKLLQTGDIVLRLRKPPIEEIKLMKKGALHIGMMDPFNEKDIIAAFEKAEVTSISLELIPRSTIAQKMDVLSSQANLAGYVSVLLAAGKLSKILPMMTTPAGTISPSRVFIIGVGVAGLQAIATAKRLGARVEAFDTRPVVEEQVQSLGAKFVKIDLGEMGQDENGYAKALTPEQLELQRQGMAKVCAQADIVITTAQLFGRKAPVIVTKDMVHGMRPGSIIVDMAVESGGNVEGSQLDKEVDVNGVTIIGFGNLPGRVATNASQMYSSNICNFLLHFWKEEEKKFDLNLEDPIIKGCVVTHEGKTINEKLT